jgi:hypothetical protein
MIHAWFVCLCVFGTLTRHKQIQAGILEQLSAWVDDELLGLGIHGYTYAGNGRVEWDGAAETMHFVRNLW